MKSMFESPEAFEAYATIDYCHWRMKETSKGMNNREPLSPIEKMIDKATGSDPDAEYLTEIRELLEALIEAKDKIGADSSEDKKMLEKIPE